MQKRRSFDGSGFGLWVKLWRERSGNVELASGGRGWSEVTQQR